MSTDQFTAALELTHNFNPNATPCHRREAEQYLMSLRSSPDGLALSLHILAEEPVNEIRCFWALNTINDHLPNLTSAEGLALSVMGAQNGSVDTVASIYHTLLTFLHAYLFSATATPVEFLLNKHAQTVALGMQAFYPTQWQSLFDDLFNLLERGRAMQTGGDAATAYVLRVFQSIDECIVNVPDRGARDKQQRARSMELKDSMRERTIPRVVDLWYRVLSDCCGRVPEISKLCLTVAQSYITWIDVNLMITPEWIQLLYFLVSNVAILRTAAYECLLSLVQKKQLPGTKYTSLAALNVVDTLPRIVQAQLSAGTSVNGTWSLVVGGSTASLGASSPCTSALGEDDTSAAIDVLSKLVVAVAEQLMTLVEACSQATSASDVAIYLQRGGLDATGALISEEPLPVSAEMAAELLRSLHTVVRQLLFIWCEADTTEVLESVLPFVQAYVKSPMLVEEEASVILTTAFEHSRLDRRYTSSLKASGMDMSTTASLTHFSAAVLWDDFIVDQRKQLYNLIRLLHRRSPDFVLQHLEKVIQEHLLSPRIEELITTSQSLPELMAALSHLEASLRYLFEMGECVKLDSCLRDAEDAYARLVGAVLMNNTSLHTAMLRGTGGATHDACTGASSLVALAYFEVMDRCYLFFQNFPNTIPNLLDRLLLQPYGVMHVEDKVRSRVCCLFGHLLQVLRSVLQPYASDMVMALQSIASTATQLQPQNRRDVYEAIGVLLRIAISSAVASHSLTSAPSGAGNQEVAKTSSIANNDTLGEDAQRVITQLVQPVLSSAVDTLQQLEGGAALNPSDAERVAEVVSYLSALVRGMGEVADFSGSSDDCSRGRGWPPVCEGLSQLLESTSAAVLRAVSAWSFSAAVREASGNYFQQALNALPLSRLASFLEPYVCGMLQRIEVVPELSRLIRLLTQVVNKDGVESLRMVAQLLPPVWEKVEQVGDLAGNSASSPVVQMGVVSESAKEKMEVYRQIFTLVFSISTWGCAESMLMMPPDMVQAFLVQAHHAIAHLPCEVELPKSAMQCVVKLYAALTTANRQRTGRALDSTAANSLSVNESKLPLAEVTAEMLHHYTQITTTIVNALLPAALQRILTADFDLKDARNYLLVGEICQLCLLAAAEGALELIFHQLQPSVGEAEAQSFCVALGTLVSANTVKLPTSMKLQFRNMVSSGSGHRIAQ